MLLLCSNGLTCGGLWDCAAQFGGKTAALVVTADNVYKEKNYHVPRAREELRQCGLDVTLFDVDTQPVGRRALTWWNLSAGIPITCCGNAAQRRR